MELHLDVVVGEAVHDALGTAVLQENRTCGAYILIIIGVQLCLGEGEEAVAALVLLLWCYDVRNLKRHGAGAFAVAEDVELGDVERLQEALGLVEEGGRLSTRANDDIHTDEGVGHELLNALHLVTEECRVVATVHEPEYFVASTLQGDVEVWHEGTAVSAELDDVVGEQIGFDTADTIAIDALDGIECLDEREEVFARSLAEIADIDTGYDNLPSALSYNVLGLLHQGFYAAVTATSAGNGDGAIGTIIIAAILDLEEIARTVATRTRGHEAADIGRTVGEMLMEGMAGGNVVAFIGSPTLFALFQQGQHTLYDLPLLLGAKHQVHTVNCGYLLWLKLGIAACDDDLCAGMLANKLMDGLPALMVGDLGHATGVDDADIGNLVLTDTTYAGSLELLPHGRSLGKIEFAAQREIGCLPRRIVCTRLFHRYTVLSGFMNMLQRYDILGEKRVLHAVF